MWTLAADPTPPHWRREAPDAAVLAFSTRRGGVSTPPFDSLNLGRSTEDDASAVAENRSRLLRALGLDPLRLATAGQVHGVAVARVAAPGHLPECDALVTTVPGVALAVTTADCLALLYHAPGAVAAAHAGWRGIAAGMPRVALDALCEAAGCDPGAVRVHLGPCIRACCYEVRDDVLAHFDPRFVTHVEGHARLDLVAAARADLCAAGLRDEQLADTGACTACEPHWYFSHRRDHGRTGRLWAVAALRA
jgi:polyphenol oxidase